MPPPSSGVPLAPSLIVLLFAGYFFRPSAFLDGLRHAAWLGITWQAFTMPLAYRELLKEIGAGSPALIFAIPIALLTYIAWPRTRYFGNTAPLLVAVVCLVFGLAAPHYQGLGFQLVAMPFLFVFVAGISADLLESKQRTLMLASISGLLLAYAILSLTELTRAGLSH